MDAAIRKAVFVDASPTLADIADDLLRLDGVAFEIQRTPDIVPDDLPAALAGATVAIIDHTYLPTPIARRCPQLAHVIFLGTGARSYMCPEELAELGIAVHTIKGYGDTAVAECAIALMWAAAPQRIRRARRDANALTATHRSAPVRLRARPAPC